MYSISLFFIIIISMKLFVKVPDIFIILLVTGITFFSFYSVYLTPQDNIQVLIRGQDNEWTFPIEAQETVIIQGTIGYTVIKIEDQKAWVESSPCDNQTCVAAGLVSHQGQWAACLPNGVLLMIQGFGGDDVDAVSW